MATKPSVAPVGRGANGGGAAGVRGFVSQLGTLSSAPGGPPHQVLGKKPWSASPSLPPPINRCARQSCAAISACVAVVAGTKPQRAWACVALAGVCACCPRAAVRWSAEGCLGCWLPCCTGCGVRKQRRLAGHPPALAAGRKKGHTWLEDRAGRCMLLWRDSWRQQLDTTCSWAKARLTSRRRVRDLVKEETVLTKPAQRRREGGEHARCRSAHCIRSVLDDGSSHHGAPCAHAQKGFPHNGRRLAPCPAAARPLLEDEAGVWPPQQRADGTQARPAPIGVPPLGRLPPPSAPNKLVGAAALMQHDLGPRGGRGKSSQSQLRAESAVNSRRAAAPRAAATMMCSGACLEASPGDARALGAAGQRRPRVV